MSAEEIFLDAEERMEKAVVKLEQDLFGIRTGRANPGLVSALRVDVYGSPTPIKQVASVTAPEPQQLVIRPFDPSIIKDIEKGNDVEVSEKKAEEKKKADFLPSFCSPPTKYHTYVTART